MKGIIYFMGMTLKEVISNEILEEIKASEPKKLKRPSEVLNLKAIRSEFIEISKHDWDATPELIEVDINCSDPVKKTEAPVYGEGSFLIQDINTKQVWIAPTELVLNNNFIYREDIDIFKIDNEDEFRKTLQVMLEAHPYGAKPSRVCYILDNPVLECITPYYNSAAVLQMYGVSTPRGCFIHKYPNRFIRDMAILKMNKKYTTESKRDIKSLSKDLTANQAIIVSDGAFLKNISANSMFYIDNNSIISMQEATIPSIPEQSVLISEIKGAINALSMCVAKGKRDIIYYYDNTSIVNCFNNKKLEYIDEVKEFKDLIRKLASSNYKVVFNEIHPKNIQEDEDDNEELYAERKGIKYFHNLCDDRCTEAAQIYNRGYKELISTNAENGLTLAALIERDKPKKPYNKNGNNNNRNGNRRN